MSVNKTDDDVVGEYLREVDLRLSGLPLLQRRELLADLSAHIEAARGSGAISEGELIEVLERLGSPEVIAAAAYEEAGARPVPPLMPPPVAPAAPRKQRQFGVPGWVIALVAGTVALFLIGCIGLATLSRSGDEGPAPADSVGIVPVPAQPEPMTPNTP